MDRLLRIGSLPDAYNRNAQRPDLGKFPLNTSVFDTLVRVDEKFDVEPMLAERWEYDGATGRYQFHLRRNVSFHDGHTLSAEDVKYTCDLLIDAMHDNHQQLGPDSVRVVDSHIVEFTPVRENRWLVEQLVHPVWGVNRAGSDPARPVGTGPYRFVDYTKGERLTVARFDRHWNRSHAPQAPGITFIFALDSASRIEGLLAGDYDLVIDVPRERAEEFDHAAGVRLVRSKVGAYNALSFNIAGEPPYELGAEPALREAVGSAVDRRALLQEVWAGNAEESTTWIPPAVLGRHASLIQAPNYDPVHAAELLDEAGWKPGSDGIRRRDGRLLELTHLLGDPGDSDARDSVPAAEFIQRALGRIGVKTTIRVAVPGALAGGEYDIFQGVANQNEAYAARLPDIIHYSHGNSGNRYRAPGGLTDQAIERARAAASTDEVRRWAAEAARQLIDVEHVVVPLIGVYRLWAMKVGVVGFVPHPSLTNQRWEAVHDEGAQPAPA